MSASIKHLIQLEIARALTQIHPHRIGVVSSYDPATHSVKLLRQPEGVETGFLPLNAHHIGNGWGVMVGPQIGDQFVIGHVLGDVDTPFIAGRLFSDQEKPPSVQSGEMLFQHQKGHKLFFDQNGGVTIYHAAKGGVMAFDASGNITHDAKGANITVQSAGGNIALNGNVDINS